jgi:UDP-N-acetylmuramoyl-tripeptide--D-alanyl-D-alanine ligase
VTPLWQAAEVAAATGGAHAGDWSASGVSIDSRTVMPGDLFVALRGPNHDGHDFVAAALARGAVAAIVERQPDGVPPAGPLVRVADSLAALTALAAAARRRGCARIVGVTGSVGKTGTKEALRLALGAAGSTYASAGGLNNHWGAPLSLARLPREAAFGVFELGMNHTGEMAALARLVRPHAALITTVEPAHLGFFASVAAIADAKAEIFLGLEPDGLAVLNRDNPHYPRLAAAARRAGAKIVGFGSHPQAEARLLDCSLAADGSAFAAEIFGRQVNCRLGAPGRHWVMNALAVLATAAALGEDPAAAATALADFEALPGRGRRDELAWRGGVLRLIDESYNASPAAMRAALAVLGMTSPGPGGRRVAVLGDMLELGAEAPALHRDLAAPIEAAGIDRVFLVGAAMTALDAVLPPSRRGGLWPTAEAAIPAVIDFLGPGDVVTVKGSRSVGASRIVERLRAAAARPEA